MDGCKVKGSSCTGQPYVIANGFPCCTSCLLGVLALAVTLYGTPRITIGETA